MPSTLPLSAIDVPVEIDLALVRDLIERELPPVHALERTWEGVALRCRIERGPVDVSFAGGTLQVRAELRYQAHASGALANVLGFGGDEMRRLRLELRSPLGIGADWQLQLAIRAEHTFVDPVEIPLLGIDVRRPVEALLAEMLGSLLPRLERRLVEAAAVPARAARAWQRLQQPIRLRDGVWLVLSPEAAHVSAPSENGDKVRFVFGIEGRPVVCAGARPVPEMRALPPLERGDRPAGAALYVQAALPWDEATRQLHGFVVGRSFSAGGKRLVIRDVTLGGSAIGAAVRLEVESDRGLFGRLRGTVYAVGRPVFDPSTGVLSFEQLDYSLESRDLPLRMAESLLRPELLSLLQKKARWQLGRPLEKARAAATRALQRELAAGVALAGVVDRIEPLEVVAGREGLVVSAAAFGRASLAIGPADAPRPAVAARQ